MPDSKIPQELLDELSAAKAALNVAGMAVREQEAKTLTLRQTAMDAAARFEKAIEAVTDAA